MILLRLGLLPAGTMWDPSGIPRVTRDLSCSLRAGQGRGLGRILVWRTQQMRWGDGFKIGLWTSNVWASNSCPLFHEQLAEGRGTMWWSPPRAYRLFKDHEGWQDDKGDSYTELLMEGVGGRSGNKPGRAHLALWNSGLTPNRRDGGGIWDQYSDSRTSQVWTLADKYLLLFLKLWALPAFGTDYPTITTVWAAQLPKTKRSDRPGGQAELAGFIPC